MAWEWHIRKNPDLQVEMGKYGLKYLRFIFQTRSSVLVKQFSTLDKIVL